MSRLAHTSALYHHRSPWMGPFAPNPIPGYYYLPRMYESAPWSSDAIHGETTKEHVRLKRDCVVQRTIVSMGRTGICVRLWTSFRGLLRSARGKKRRPKKNKLDTHTLPFMPYDQRNTYLTGSHPTADCVQVRNSTPRCSSSVTIDTQDLWERPHADDAQCPEITNWPLVNRATLHSGLPPYAPPRNDIQLPTTPFSNVRLNPYLEHHCNGPHPISFDVTLGPAKIMHTSSSSTSLDPASFFKKLATQPPVKQMRVQCVAEDPLPHIPWPIEIENMHGITCGDVLDAVANKFLEYVGEEEYNTWTKHRRGIAARTYHQRVRTTTDEGLRRIDYLGGKVVFHGLELASVMMGDMWFMFVGASERS